MFPANSHVADLLHLLPSSIPIIHNTKKDLPFLYQFGEKDGGTISIVHKSWLTPRKTEVYWPPYKKQILFDKALKKGEPADIEKWELFKIKRSLGAFDNFIEAKKKEKIAEYTSDLERNWNTEEEIGSHRKRQPKRPLRFSDTVEDSSDTEEDSYLSRPPKISKNFDISSDTHPVQPTHNDSVNVDNIFSAYEESCLFNNDYTAFSNQYTEAVPINIPSTASNDIPCNHEKNAHSPHRCSENANSLNISNEVLQMLVSQLSTLIEQNKEILNILKNRNNFMVPAQSNNFPPKVPVTLPLESEGDFEILENYLNHSCNEKQLCLYLSNLDRNNLVSATNSALRFCLTYDLARSFSFLGSRNNKKAFCNYKLKKIIVGAVKLAIPTTTERNIEDQIKIWLKRSTKSFILERTRQQKRGENGV